jgi:hypothetical protein
MENSWAKGKDESRPGMKGKKAEEGTTILPLPIAIQGLFHFICNL